MAAYTRQCQAEVLITPEGEHTQGIKEQVLGCNFFLHKPKFSTCK